MSQTYRLLREGMPGPQGLGKAEFPADVRKTREWVAALPRANAQATRQELALALDSLAGQRLDGASRLSVLEQLRPAVVESIGLLQRQFVGSALPLPADKATAAHQVEAFHQVLAHGYRKTVSEICAPDGNVPMFRGGAVVQALARASWHYSQALVTAWRIYRTPAPGVWQGLHRIRNYAAEQKLDSKAVEDPVAGYPVEIRTLYLQALLMAISRPLAFSQAEQDTLWQLARGFAKRCGLRRQVPEGSEPVVPEDADHGPGPGVAGESYTQWLDMRAFSDEVDSALERQRDGFSELFPERGVSVRVSLEMLQRLKRAFGLAAARTHKRLSGGHQLRTVIGLSGLHFYLAGQRDFDTFMRQASQHIVHVVDRASWAGAATDASRVPMFSANVLDQSLGGYRMVWDDADQIRVRVGELVGITLADEDEVPEWMLGIVRWLRYQSDGGLSAGVELFARRIMAVGLRVHRNSGPADAPMRALEVEMTDDGMEHCFLVASGQGVEAARIEVVRDEADSLDAGAPSNEDMLAGIDVLLNVGDYTLLRPLSPDLAAGAANGVRP